MNPLFQSILMSFFRWGLTLVAGWLVEHQVWAKDEAGGYVSGLALALVTLCWAIWARYRSRVKFLTALEAPAGATEAHVIEKIAEGKGASAL